MNFHFDLVLELVRTEAEKKHSLGKPEALRFERFGEIVTLENKEEQEGLLTWRDALSPILNQRGFHELFKPIKKVGKGNFASVYLAYKH